MEALANVEMNELSKDELMMVEGGLGNKGKFIMGVGGAVVAGIGAPVAGAAAAAYGTTAAASTVASGMSLGFSMMSSTL